MLTRNEIQIWFQNRRQNDRRKARPLSPQEIAQLRFGGSLHMLSSDPPSFSTAEGVNAIESTRSDGVDLGSTTPTHSPSQERPQASLTEGTASAELPKQERRHSEPTSSTLPRPSSDEEEHDEAPALSQSFSSKVGYLSNRWHMNESFSAPSTVERPKNEPFRYVEMRCYIFDRLINVKQIRELHWNW
jgi:hypothetical protein